MPVDWDRRVARWSAAGVIDAETADRIRRYEASDTEGSRTRRSVWLAAVVGIVLVGAGLLLLVSATWNDLSPLARLALVASLPLALHLAAAGAPRFADALHLAGSVALGPCIFTGAAILGLSDHWPSAVLLWAIGAAGAWLIRRDVPHAAFGAVLGPAWLLCEWAALGETHALRLSLVGQAGAVLLALAYFGEPGTREASPLRRTLGWLGAAALVPAGMLLGVQAGLRAAVPDWIGRLPVLPPVPPLANAVAWVVALAIPTAVAFLLSGRRARLNLVAAAWVVLLAVLPASGGRLLVYGWLAAGAIGLGAWSARRAFAAGVNLSTAAFAVLLLFFYFDDVMGQVGRSASLIGLGVLFLAVGAGLERMRRQALDRAAGGVR